MYKTPFSDNWKYWKMWLVNVPSKKFKIAQFGALSPLTNQRTGSPNFSKEQSGESVHKLFKESMGEGSTKTVQRTNETKIFLNNKFWMNVSNFDIYWSSKHKVNFKSRIILLLLTVCEAQWTEVQLVSWFKVVSLCAILSERDDLKQGLTDALELNTDPEGWK